MNLLDALAPSAARKILLKLLWREEVAGSIRELARRAGIGYSAAHRELNHLRGAGLVRSRRRGRAIWFERDPSHPQASLVASLVADRSDVRAIESSGDDATIRDLADLGAPLLASPGPGSKRSPEEAIAAGLMLARRRPAVARVMPIVLLRTGKRLDFSKLSDISHTLGEERTLGFFLELTSLLSRDPTFRRWARSLRIGSGGRWTDFFLRPTGRYGRALSDRNTPAVAKQWRYRMNMPMESFETTFRKFVGEDEALLGGGSRTAASGDRP